MGRRGGATCVQDVKYRTCACDLADMRCCWEGSCTRVCCQGKPDTGKDDGSCCVPSFQQPLVGVGEESTLRGG
eukprot:scaffold209447_cov23-Tisochrysis_lutea.AAC.4